MLTILCNHSYTILQYLLCSLLGTWVFRNKRSANLKGLSQEKSVAIVPLCPLSYPSTSALQFLCHGSCSCALLAVPIISLIPTCYFPFCTSRKFLFCLPACSWMYAQEITALFQTSYPGLLTMNILTKKKPMQFSGAKRCPALRT